MIFHEELTLILEETDPEFNDQWIEELSFRVNTCFASIDSYLFEREGDPSSSISSYKTRQDIEQWRHAASRYSSRTSSEYVGNESIPEDLEHDLSNYQKHVDFNLQDAIKIKCSCRTFI